MTLIDLKATIESYISETKEYDEFLKKEVKPALTPVGHEHYLKLHFFNVGYEYAMKDILKLLSKVECPKCDNYFADNGNEIEDSTELLSEIPEAHKKFKEKVVTLMFEATAEYAAPGSRLYPYCGKILVDVLKECLEEAKRQMETPF